MSIILLLLAVLLSLAGVFYYLQSRRVLESQSAEPADAAPSRPRDAQGADAAGSTEGASRGGRLSGHFSAAGRGPKNPAGVEGKPASTLQGNLAETPLHDFLQYLSLGRKAGILELASGRRTGRMVFQGGKVYKASFRGKEGLDAAFLMLDLPEGDFEFHEQALDESPAQHPLEVVDVIMLWMDKKPKKKQAAR